MDEINLLAVGDIYLKANKNQDPFRNVYSIFNHKDILFGNLETSLTETGSKTDKAVVLSTNPKNIKFLKKADFDVLNLANNHILDLGEEGFAKTIRTLQENNMGYVGADYKNTPEILFLEQKGIIFAFLGYSIGRFKTSPDVHINKIRERKILADIDLVKNKCDFIIVSLHWGTENVFYPSPSQIKLAHKIIDHGATLILGHHPHTIQGIEEYNNGLIVYSLGNFQFDPKLSQSKSNKSMIVSVKFDKNRIFGYDIVPVSIKEDIPELMEQRFIEKYMEFISKISEPINRKISRLWWFQEIGSEYLSNNIHSYKMRIGKYGIFHLIEFILWLFTPFCLCCYVGIISKKIRVIF